MKKMIRKMTLQGLVLLISISYAAGRKNVLFMVADDLRPEISALYKGSGQMYPNMHTPNFDKFAGESVVFRNSHSQQAVCSPSRTSFMTGRRPDTTRCYNLVDYWRTVAGNFTTIPQYFKENGYRTLGMGKLFHEGDPAPNDDAPLSWSADEDYFHAPTVDEYWGAVELDRIHYPVNDSFMELHPLKDQQTADHAVETLRRLAPKAKSGEENFFMGVGFHLPHMPFVYPEKFGEYYPIEDVAMPTNPYAPANMPIWNWDGNSEISRYGDIAARNLSREPNTTWPDYLVRDLRQGYYASVSFTDSLFGQVLDELEAQGLKDNTIVIFFSDHGWTLYEHTMWGKKTNLDLTTRTTFMLNIPGTTDGGMESNHLVEMVDIFSTLAELAELPTLPTCPEDSRNVERCTEGTSLVPIINNPDLPGKSRVFTQYPRDKYAVSSPLQSFFKRALTPEIKINMGYSMVTERYRYTEYVDFDTAAYLPNWDDLLARELYDHQSDPDENVNVASFAAYAALIPELSKDLRSGWRDVLAENKETTVLPGDVLWSCDFEDELLCGMTNDISADPEYFWQRHSGVTPSGQTGPERDHTTGSNTGNYIYAEGSPPRQPEEVASVLTPSVSSGEFDKRLELYANMNGDDIGSLVIKTINASKQVQVASIEGNQGTEWKRLVYRLPPGEYQVMLTSVRGSGWKSDVAVDDITITVWKDDVVGVTPTVPTVGPTTTTVPVALPSPDAGAVVQIINGECWVSFPESYLPSANYLTLSGKTESQCLTECISAGDFVCMSVDCVTDGTCILSDKNRRTANVLQLGKSNDITYYERVVCPTDATTTQSAPTTAKTATTTTSTTPTTTASTTPIPTSTVPSDDDDVVMPVSARLVDGQNGVGLNNVAVGLYKLSTTSGLSWEQMATGTANSEGLVEKLNAVNGSPGIISPGQMYTLQFNIDTPQTDSAFPAIQVVFQGQDGIRQYHFQVLVSGATYTITQLPYPDTTEGQC